jgi:hypothetical protein
MDLRFSAYTQLFRFDPTRLDGKLKVRAFEDQADFDAYLTAKLGERRAGGRVPALWKGRPK